jgi:hypothetical protein
MTLGSTHSLTEMSIGLQARKADLTDIYEPIVENNGLRLGYAKTSYAVGEIVVLGCQKQAQ